MNFAIEKKLREHDIEIPFPQRDLHIRSGAIEMKK
jgi:small-conductance mechanosensitive channel